MSADRLKLTNLQEKGVEVTNKGQHLFCRKQKQRSCIKTVAMHHLQYTKFTASDSIAVTPNLTDKISYGNGMYFVPFQHQFSRHSRRSQKNVLILVHFLGLNFHP